MPRSFLVKKKDRSKRRKSSGNHTSVVASVGECCREYVSDSGACQRNGIPPQSPHNVLVETDGSAMETTDDISESNQSVITETSNVTVLNTEQQTVMYDRNRHTNDIDCDRTLDIGNPELLVHKQSAEYVTSAQLKFEADNAYMRNSPSPYSVETQRITPTDFDADSSDEGHMRRQDLTQDLTQDLSPSSSYHTTDSPLCDDDLPTSTDSTLSDREGDITEYKTKEMMKVEPPCIYPERNLSYPPTESFIRMYPKDTGAPLRERDLYNMVPENESLRSRSNYSISKQINSHGDHHHLMNKYQDPLTLWQNMYCNLPGTIMSTPFLLPQKALNLSPPLLQSPVSSREEKIATLSSGGYLKPPYMSPPHQTVAYPSPQGVSPFGELYSPTPVTPLQHYYKTPDPMYSRNNVVQKVLFNDSPRKLVWSPPSRVEEDKKQQDCSGIRNDRKRIKGVPQRYGCEHCKKSYSTYSGLSKHKQFHCSSQVKKDFSCKHCDKTYTSLGALKMHIRTHTLPCKCQICGKAFSRPWLLQGHIRTHTGEKPFICPHCGRSFADRSNLRAHLQTHSDVKKYSCKTCAKTFSRMSLLLKHEDGGCTGMVV